MTLDDCDEYFAVARKASSESQVADVLRHLFAFYKVLSFEFGRGSVFWRGRKTQGQPFENITEILTPPAESTPAGRLNNARCPGLYTSTRRSTVLAELGVRAGDFVQLAGLRIKPKSHVRLGTIGELMHVHKSGYLRTLGTDPDNGISRFLNSMEPAVGKRFIYIDAFLASLLADGSAGEQDYAATRSIAKLAFSQGQIDGFFYPSVQDHIGMNLVLLPETAESKVHAVCLQHIKITKVREFGIYDYEVLLVATGIQSKTVTWKRPVSQNSLPIFGLSEPELAFLRENPANANALLDLTGMAE